MNRQDFKNISLIRLRDAKVLLKNRNYSGAYYLVGYVVECALKACIARQTRQFEFPDKQKVQNAYTHNLVKLVELAGLKTALDNQGATNSVFATNRAIVKVWSEESRYQSYTQMQAQDLYDAISDPTDGVLPWMKLHW